MTSEAKANASRRNAEKSTGPKTEEGKAAVVRNAVTHGLTSQYDVLSFEDVAEFLCWRRVRQAEEAVRSVPARAEETPDGVTTNGKTKPNDRLEAGGCGLEQPHGTVCETKPNSEGQGTGDAGETALAGPKTQESVASGRAKPQRTNRARVDDPGVFC